MGQAAVAVVVDAEMMAGALLDRTTPRLQHRPSTRSQRGELSTVLHRPGRSEGPQLAACTEVLGVHRLVAALSVVATLAARSRRAVAEEGCRRRHHSAGAHVGVADRREGLVAGRLVVRPEEEGHHHVVEAAASPAARACQPDSWMMKRTMTAMMMRRTMMGAAVTARIATRKMAMARPPRRKHHAASSFDALSMAGSVDAQEPIANTPSSHDVGIGEGAAMANYGT